MWFKSAIFIVVACLTALAAVWGRNWMAAREVAAELRVLDERALELKKSALLPGSVLACLDAIAPAIQDSCEKSLFASPQAVAGAVTYVSAQLSLLTTAKNLRASAPNYSDVLTAVRGSLERDRFGTVAHLFTLRPDCGSDHCDLFAPLQNTSRVKANLIERRFESYLKAHFADWPHAGREPTQDSTSGSSPAGTALPAGAIEPATKLFLPSSSSIPPVNIMSSESALTEERQETAASADAAAQGRKPQERNPRLRRDSGARGDESVSGPLQIAPRPQ
jgi:hypothetical protein